MPDEIVISVSERTSVEPVQSQIPVKVLYTHERAFAGKNRNITACQSTGDLLIFNDADDLPSLKRVEIIKKVFESDQRIAMIVHDIIWNMDTNEFIKKTNAINEHAASPLQLGRGAYANGPVTITKELFENVKWNPDRPKAQDVEFVQAAYDYCAANNLKAMHIQSPIYLYRNKLSSKIETKL